MKGLVLEGGGAKGSYHIGAIKALSENGYEFDGVTGTSVGAINAALVAQGDIDLCYELWSTALPSTILDVDDDEIENLLSLNINIKTVKYFFKLIGKTLKNGGVSVKRVEQMIEKYIDEDKIRKSKMDFGIVTVSWSDRLQPLELFKEEIPADMMRDYILASAYYPAFQGKKINGKRYLDGGFYDNLPINPLIKRGYKEIIAIRTKRNNINVRKVIDNTVKIDYIQPMESLGGTLVFNNEKMLKNINLGYHDALRYIHNYLGEYYYVEYETNERFSEKALNFDEEFFKEVCIVLRKEYISKEQTLEDLKLYMNKRLRSNKKDFNYYDSLVLFLENVAKSFKLERFKVYKFYEFLYEIQMMYHAEDYRDRGFMEYIKVNFYRAELFDLFEILMRY